MNDEQAKDEGQPAPELPPLGWLDHSDEDASARINRRLSERRPRFPQTDHLILFVPQQQDPEDIRFLQQRQ
jgi:hypothetical protein